MNWASWPQITSVLMLALAQSVLTLAVDSNPSGYATVPVQIATNAQTAGFTLMPPGETGVLFTNVLQATPS